MRRVVTSRSGSFNPVKETRWPWYGWLDGPRAGLDSCGKSRPHWDSIPGPYSRWRVTIPTELSQPQKFSCYCRQSQHYFSPASSQTPSTSNASLIAACHCLPGLVQIPFVAKQQGRKVRRQLQLAEFVQYFVGVVEAVPVADAIYNHEGLAPPDVVVQTARGLQR